MAVQIGSGMFSGRIKTPFVRVPIGSAHLSKGYRCRMIVNFGAEYSTAVGKVYIARESEFLFKTRSKAVAEMMSYFAEDGMDVPDSGGVHLSTRYEGSPRWFHNLMLNNVVTAFDSETTVHIPDAELEAAGVKEGRGEGNGEVAGEVEEGFDECYSPSPSSTPPPKQRRVLCC